MAVATERLPLTPVVQRRYPKARLFARFWAQCIDMWIGIAMPVIVSGIGLAMSKGRPLRIVNVLLFISSIIWAIYYTFTKDSHNEGRSIGKRAMGLMVVNVSTNQPCSAGESSIRALIKGLVGAVPFIGWCVEPGFVLFSEDGRRLGDRAAGTQVIEYRDYTGF